eukprot:Amastigsp_a343061_19.p3 type:complete len:157 gc:universal Amastigsp_a343061_19:507-977(+)
MGARCSRGRAHCGRADAACEAARVGRLRQQSPCVAPLGDCGVGSGRRARPSHGLGPRRRVGGLARAPDGHARVVRAGRRRCRLVEERSLCAVGEESHLVCAAGRRRHPVVRLVLALWQHPGCGARRRERSALEGGSRRALAPSLKHQRARRRCPVA